MPATVNIVSHHGAAGATQTNVDGGSVRFKLSDDDTVDANNPIAIPTGADVYSYIKQFRFSAGTTPSNTINNLKFYMDGANGFGTGVSLNVKTSASYTNPLTQTTTALGSTASAFTYTSGSPLSVTGSISNPSTGLFGDYIQMQMQVANTATQGTTGSETATFQYDES